MNVNTIIEEQKDTIQSFNHSEYKMTFLPKNEHHYYTNIGRRLKKIHTFTFDCDTETKPLNEHFGIIYVSPDLNETLMKHINIRIQTATIQLHPNKTDKLVYDFTPEINDITVAFDVIIDKIFELSTNKNSIFWQTYSGVNEKPQYCISSITIYEEPIYTIAYYSEQVDDEYPTKFAYHMNITVCDK